MPEKTPLQSGSIFKWIVMILFVSGCSSSALVVSFPPYIAPATPDSMLVVGYYPTWAAEDNEGYQVQDIPAHLLTHVNLAFADVDSTDGTVKVGFPDLDLPKRGRRSRTGNFEILKRLREHNPHLKALISVGGWTWSAHFSEAARTADSRKRFAESAAAFVVEHGFDGVDIDWEYPASDGLQPGYARDTRNFTLFLKALREELDRVGQENETHYLLTIAAPASVEMARRMELDQIHLYLDWINVMTYDFAGSWSEQTNFNAPLFSTTSEPQPADSSLKQANVHDAMQTYLDGGIPPGKLVVGVPFFGKSWKGVADENDGLYQENEGSARMSTTWHQVSTKYKEMEHFWHDEAQVPWLFDRENGVMITYENPRSVELKGEYIATKGFAGAMFWELTGDTFRNELLSALLRGMSGN